MMHVVRLSLPKREENSEGVLAGNEAYDLSLIAIELFLNLAIFGPLFMNESSPCSDS